MLLLPYGLYFIWYENVESYLGYNVKCVFYLCVIITIFSKLIFLNYKWRIIIKYNI